MEITLSADYNELETKMAKNAIALQETGKLDLTNTSLKVAVKNIDLVSNDVYIQLRRHGFGASDSSIILGCNPFKNREQLIAEKISTEISAEERAIGEKTAVKKGNDLEPLIIQKFAKAFQQPIIKPTDMYVHKEYSYLTMNFDGVTGTPEQYFPAEIKVVTMYGEKHYDFTKAMYNEIAGFLPLPEDVSERNWSIENKAAHYGIPPYYYTQVQQQMLGLNAPFGHLSVLRDSTWVMYTYYIPRDEMMLRELITQGYKVWNTVEAAGQQGFTDINIETYENAIVQYMKDHHVSWAEAKNAVHVVNPKFMK